MMKTFTQKIMFCVAILGLFSTMSTAQTFMVVNAPGDIAGDYNVVLGQIGAQDVMSISGDMILGVDGVVSGTAGTETDGCEALTNAADVSGKIVIIDRAECPFWMKGMNAQAAGAIAMLVCNNDPDEDPYAMPFGSNGEGGDITIPCYMASTADCNVIKMSIADGNVVNATFEERVEDCPVMYDDVVFWGDMPGQGNFNGDLGTWQNVNTQPVDRPDVVWVATEDRSAEFPQFFGNGVLFDSPSGCNGFASFSAVKYSLGDNPNPGAPPYPTYAAELISPSIDCTGKDSIILEFYSLYNNLNNDDSSISISIDGGNSWEIIGMIADLSANTLQDVLETELIRIPVPQMVNQADCRIKFSAAQDFYYWSIDDVTLRSGTFRDVRANNFFATSSNYYGPTNQAAEIPFLIDVQNLGNSTVDIDATVEVLQGTDVLHTQTITYTDVEPGATQENRPFPDTYTPPAEAGEYTIRYTVASSIGDDAVSNNVQQTNFIQEDGARVMSKLPLNYDNLGNWGRPGISYLSYGAYYKFPSTTHANGTMITVDSINVGVSQDEETPAITGFLEAEIFIWNDDNGDRIVQPEERTPIGEGSATVLADGFYSIALNDINDEDAKITLDLSAGDGILAMIHQNSIEPGLTWRPAAISTGDPLSTAAADLAFDTLARLGNVVDNYIGFTVDGATGDDKDGRAFERSGQLTHYCPIFLGDFVSGVNDIDESISLGIFPNPTADLLNIDLEFEQTAESVLISILDNTGKFVRGMSFENITSKSTSMNVSMLPAGAYHLKIQTPNGYSTKQFIVQK